MIRRVLGRFDSLKFLSQFGGPIGSTLITPCRDKSIGLFHAGAKLVDHLRPRTLEVPALFDDLDGCGSAANPNLAVRIAMTEAIERWAYYEVRYSPEREGLGLHLDDSTNGFASRPVFDNLSPREAAYSEALERYLFTSWWIDPNKFSVSLDLQNRTATFLFSDKRFVQLVWSVLNNKYVYGFSAGQGANDLICKKARIELFRNEIALQRASEVAKTTFLLREKRMDYFSTPEGWGQILSRLKVSEQRNVQNVLPKLIIDSEVFGKWSRICRVWRCLFDTPTSEEVEFFRF